MKLFSMPHTIALSGCFECTGEVLNKHIEIDMNKAYTQGTIDTVRIPVFSEFDIWKKFDYPRNDVNKIHSLTLYLVKSKVRNIFLNRTYNLFMDSF